jgi:NTP pyrophosphatase (non-canonical NTP hydrolase)
MDFNELSQRANEVRAKYAALEHKKYGREWTTEQIAEGFVGDVGDLMKLVLGKDGIRDIDDVDAKLAHELSDCLWCILVLARRYDIDLESAFVTTMNELDDRIDALVADAGT